MTGKDLIKYILENDLENEPIVQNGKILGFISLEEAAVKFNVGTATVSAWYSLGVIEGFDLCGRIFILKNAEPKIKKDDRFDITNKVLEQYIENH